MLMKSSTLSNLRYFFDDGSQEILQTADRFGRSLTNLQYEGKMSFGKNWKEACQSLRSLDDRFTSHRVLEEEIIFPFLQTHVPKLESMILLFKSENQDIKKNLEHLTLLLQDRVGDQNDTEKLKRFEKIHKIGTYFAYLIRHHFQTKNNNFYKNALDSLSPDEIQMLEDKVKRKVGANTKKRF